MKTQFLTVLLMTTIALGLAGCASEPTVLPAKAHAPASPEHVKIFQKRPDRYEQLGTVRLEITPEMKWDERGDASMVFELLKQKAAAMGANGLLLWAEPGAFDLLATAGYKGTFHQVPIKRELPKRWAVGQAVYVP